VRFRYPKRWSRAKRKARRAVDLLAWRRVELARALASCLDAIWGAEMNAPSWLDSGFAGLGIGELL